MNAVCHYLQPGICQAVPWDPGPLIYYSWSMTWDPFGHHDRVSFLLKLGSICNTGLYERLRIQRGISFSPLDQRIFNSSLMCIKEIGKHSCWPLFCRISDFLGVTIFLFKPAWCFFFKYCVTASGDCCVKVAAMSTLPRGWR